MSIEGVSGSKEPSHFYSPGIHQINWSKAQSAYDETVKELLDHSERHAEVGILFPSGKEECVQLGKKEEYGAHRVGSVTKTFTTFLALKLIQDGALPNGLKTKCGEIFSDDQEFLELIFEDPEIAKEMTLEQLLSHTSGIEYGDHSRTQESSAPTLYDRFVQEGLEGRKYRHIVHPGDRVGCYSNAGLAVAGLMLEKAYNDYNDAHQSFAQIMHNELFEQVFDMKESVIKPGPTNDPIQSPAGDMNSSVPDLLQAARKLQQGEGPLEPFFGRNWQTVMLEPRDLFEEHGLGCEAGRTSIEHKGLNRELFGNEERDVSSIVIFPLSPHQASLVAMCDSNALGPSGSAFIHELETLIPGEEPKPKKKESEKEFYIPADNFCFFRGNTYLITDCDPFNTTPDTINCSLNGAHYILKRQPNLDKPGIQGYEDQDDKPWLMITTQDQREIIVSPHCILSERVPNASLKQPDVAKIHFVTGVYRNAITPKAHPTFTFREEKGQLFIREDGGKEYPCLYIPEKNTWVSAMLPTMQFQFPEDPDTTPLLITDIFSDDQELPKECHRVEKF